MSNGNAESKRGSKWPNIVLISGILALLGVVITMIAYTRYPDDGMVSDAQQSAKNLEKACKSYALNFDGVPPATLQELISPKNGGRPYIEGGQVALIDPWGSPYQYDPSHKQPDGTPDPLVFTINPNTNKPIYAAGRTP